MKRYICLLGLICALLTGCDASTVSLHEIKTLCPQGAHYIKLHEGGIEQIKCK